MNIEIKRTERISLNSDNFQATRNYDGSVAIHRLGGPHMTMRRREIDELINVLKTLQQEIDQCEDRP
jgi:hypothetical protein